MAKVKPDLSFEREGRGLGAWLLDVVSPEIGVRSKAGEALKAMAYGVPSGHTNFGDIEGELPDQKERMAEWKRAVREAVSAEGFPRRAFFVAVATMMTGPRGPSLSLVTLTWVMEAVGAMAAVDAPEALRVMLEREGAGPRSRVALKALEEAGPAAAGEFYPWLMEQFDAAKGWWLAEMGALASVGREEPGLVARALDEIGRASARAGREGWKEVTGDAFYKEYYEADRTWVAAEVLARLGAEVQRREEVLAALMELSRSPRPGHRGAAASALGRVGHGIGGSWEGRIVDRLLELTRDHNWVVGRAINALGEMGADAGRVVPRLLELFDGFEEYDPDQAYGGGHARVCRAIAAFGERAAPAVPRLVRALQKEAQGADVGGEDFPKDLVTALGSIGPAAGEALPLLEAVWQKRRAGSGGRRHRPPDREREPARWAVWRVRGS